MTCQMKHPPLNLNEEYEIMISCLLLFHRCLQVLTAINLLQDGLDHSIPKQQRRKINHLKRYECILQFFRNIRHLL